MMRYFIASVWLFHLKPPAIVLTPILDFSPGDASTSDNCHSKDLATIFANIKNLIARHPVGEITDFILADWPLSISEYISFEV
jgi:hypothetical protein